MAIYHKLEQMDKDITEAKEGLKEYWDNEAFAEGYDTCYDVATCVNAQTVWTRNDGETEIPEGNLILYVPGLGMLIGWQAISMNGWVVPQYGLLPMDKVVCWMELPDVPEVMG